MTTPTPPRPETPAPTVRDRQRLHLGTQIALSDRRRERLAKELEHAQGIADGARARLAEYDANIAALQALKDSLS